MADFNPTTDALDHGSTRGAHGQENGLRWAWVHEGDEDVILFHDEPRNIYRAIRCGDFEIQGVADVLHVLGLSYFAPPFCQEQGCSVPVYPTSWDSRASYL
jgi:hypothetical protein